MKIYESKASYLLMLESKLPFPIIDVCDGSEVAKTWKDLGNLIEKELENIWSRAKTELSFEIWSRDLGKTIFVTFWYGNDTICTAQVYSFLQPNDEFYVQNLHDAFEPELQYLIKKVEL